MGTAVVALLTGMTTLFGSASGNRQSTTAAIVVRDYTEALNVAVASAWCSATYTVSYTPPTGYSVSPAYGACPANTAATVQIQTVTITATAPNGATEVRQDDRAQAMSLLRRRRASAVKKAQRSCSR